MSTLCFMFLMVLRTNRINSLVFIMKESVLCIGTEFVFHPSNIKTTSLRISRSWARAS